MNTEGVSIQIKRVYDPADTTDGFRVLVDRLWPRGVSKERAKLDAWAKDLAPSDALRRQFHHAPDRWEEFRVRYRAELVAPSKQAALAALVAHAGNRRMTLLYAAKDRIHNNARVLKEVLEELVATNSTVPSPFIEER